MFITFFWQFAFQTHRAVSPVIESIYDSRLEGKMLLKYNVKCLYQIGIIPPAAIDAIDRIMVAGWFTIASRIAVLI